ncbi:MAG: hypothetical protein H0U73_04485 [Tatlockia sp.]|nr:hypothetical protein [Tatlockia sp.]
MRESFEITLTRLKNNDASLSSLNLGYNYIGDAGAKDISEALKTNTSLSRLDLRSNQIRDAGVKDLSEALKTNTSLSSLDLAGNKIGADGAKDFSEALKTNSSLSSLNLKLNRIGDAGAKSLSEALKTNTSLSNLNLQANQIGAAGAKDISEALKTNTSLSSLNLGHNEIGAAGAKDISEALKTNTSLSSLDLVGNKIGAAGAKDISKILETSTSLSSLDLWDNQIGAAGAKDISEALKTNTSLSSLDLRYNQIGDAGAKSLSEALKTNTSLASLRLANNNISAQGMEFLKQALQSNYTLLEIEGNVDPQITECLTRNKALNDILKPLIEVLNKKSYLNKGDTIEGILSLQTLFPDLDSLPEDSYPFEAYRLLTALSFRTHFSIEAKLDALEYILSPFKHQPYQHYADKIVGLLLSGDLSQVLEQHKLAKIGFLLTLTRFKAHLDQPEVNNFAQMALFKLIHDTHYDLQNHYDFKESTSLITEKEFLNLLKKALSQCENTNPFEAQLLKALLYSPICSFSLATASQSSAFYETFKAPYPNATGFTTVDHCLLTYANGSSDFLIGIKKPIKVITGDDLAEYGLKLVGTHCKTTEAVEDDLKRALELEFFSKDPLVDETNIEGFISMESRSEQAVRKKSPKQTAPVQLETTSNQASQQENSLEMDKLPEIELANTQGNNSANIKVQSSDLMLFICRFLDEISPLAFFIPLIGQVYLVARIANEFKPLTQGTYSFFSCFSTEENNDIPELSWNFD